MMAAAGPLAAQTSTPASDALKRLQEQQARDNAVRKQDIAERLRQSNQAQQQKAVTDPKLRQQLEAGDAAQHQQYRTHRDDLLRQFPNMPRPSEQAVPAPASSSSKNTASGDGGH